MIDWSDVQGIVLKGYKDKPMSVFALVKVTDRAAACGWLDSIATALTVVSDLTSPEPGSARPGASNAAESGAKVPAEDSCYLNIAFTRSGLEALGMEKPDLDGFSDEFLEGMAPDPDGRSGPYTRRSGILGDIDVNAATHWSWGGIPAKGKKKRGDVAAIHRDEIHILLAVYGNTVASVNSALKVWVLDAKGVALCRNGAKGQGNPSLHQTNYPADGREHFGFVDSISQPILRGTKAAAKMSQSLDKSNVVEPGEFLFGYENERRLLPDGPTVAGKSDLKDVLPAKDGRKDLGKNGTYLVVRQLEQDVPAFNALIDTIADDLGESMSLNEAREWAAARLMGRFRTGAPLTPENTALSAAALVGGNRDNNDFLYYYADRDGLHCPISSHVRRANPRDSLGPDPESALLLSKRHRILRRGRLYGPHYDPDSGERGREAEHVERGLFFLGLNTDIAGQYENIQHSWVNNPHFAGQYEELDPIIGQGGDQTTSLTIQGRPVNLRLENISRLIKVRGGGYFFLPGKRAIRYLANLPGPSGSEPLG